LGTFGGGKAMARLTLSAQGRSRTVERPEQTRASDARGMKDGGILA
jgi:hypothetical protein